MSLFRAGLLAKRRPSGAHGWSSWWTMPATRLQCVVLPMLLVVILVKGSEDATSHSHAQYHVAAGVWISLPVPDLYPLSSSSDFTGTKWALQDLALWRTNPSSLWHRQSLLYEHHDYQRDSPPLAKHCLSSSWEGKWGWNLHVLSCLEWCRVLTVCYQGSVLIWNGKCARL